MQNNIISSPQNPLIKNIIQLQNKKSARKKQKLFIVEGIKSIQEIPKHYHVKYYITTPLVEKKQIPALDEKKWIIVTQEVYKTISDTETPQGAMAIVEIPELQLENLSVDPLGVYLVLENLQDPGNLGTIIRTAHAFGIKQVLISKGSVDLYSPKVVRSTMGSLFHVTAYTDYDIDEYIYHLKKHKICTYVTDLEESQPIFQIAFQKPMAIIIGNEGNGVSEYVKQIADYKMKIPMPGGSESLNASIAASICIYEVMRQQYQSCD